MEHCREDEGRIEAQTAATVILRPSEKSPLLLDVEEFDEHGEPVRRRLHTEETQ